MQVYSITEARKIIGDLVSQVKFGKKIIALGRNKKVEAFLVPSPDLNEEIPTTLMNSASSSFDFLKEEPDIYSLGDLQESYV